MSIKNTSLLAALALCSMAFHIEKAEAAPSPSVQQMRTVSEKCFWQGDIQVCRYAERDRRGRTYNTETRCRMANNQRKCTIRKY